jgi:hypothetical protein
MMNIFIKRRICLITLALMYGSSVGLLWAGAGQSKNKAGKKSQKTKRAVHTYENSAAESTVAEGGFFAQGLMALSIMDPMAGFTLSSVAQAGVAEPPPVSPRTDVQAAGAPPVPPRVDKPEIPRRFLPPHERDELRRQLLVHTNLIGLWERDWPHFNCAAVQYMKHLREIYIFAI